MLIESQVKIMRKSLRKINRKLGVLKKDPFEINLSLSQCHALVDLQERGPISASELVTSLHLEKSTISRLVKQLIDQKLVMNTADEHDGRKKILFLTADGKKKLDIINKISNKEISNIFQHFDILQTNEIIQSFQNLSETLEE